MIHGIKHYSFELFVVTLGVFIGMWVSDWSTTQNENKLRKDFLASIRSEMQDNMKLLKRYEANRLNFYNSLDSLSKNLSEKIRAEKFDKAPFKKRIPNWVGMGLSKLNSSMFDAIKYSNILLQIDIHLLKQISQVYNYQENSHQLYLHLSKQFSEKNSKSYGEIMDLMWNIRQELFGSQYMLIKMYEHAIQNIHLELKK